MSSIRCKAAVCWAPNEPLEIEEVEVEAPRANEVRIKLVASGLCHTDATAMAGLDSEVVYPVILGHEGAGIVESIGPGVTNVQPGDHVIPCYIPQCYECKFCKSAKTNLCSVIRETQGKGLMPDGTSRFRCRGKTIYHYMGTSCFSQYTVVAAISVAKINSEAPLETIGLLGCGIPTGLGAALNAAKVEPGSSCAIWGLGCVGLATVMGCRMAGASRIICIDVDAGKLNMAKRIGGTDFIVAGETDDNAKQRVIDLTDGGADFTFECVGKVQVMRAALEACHKGWGVSTMVGVAPSGAEISTRPFQLVTGRTWKGVAFGGWKSRDDVPNLVQQVLDRKIDLDFFVSGKKPLSNINDAFADLHSGTCIRTLVHLF